MSEYEYTEFCSLYSPLSPEAISEMRALSSRACVTTHGASYVYHYSCFRGNTQELLLKHFDVYFFLSKFSILELIFKYRTVDLDIDALRYYEYKDTITVNVLGPYTLVGIRYTDEECFSGWLEGEGILPDLLPLYDEIKSENYNILYLVAVAVDKAASDVLPRIDSDAPNTNAQKAFFRHAQLGEYD